MSIHSIVMVASEQVSCPLGDESAILSLQNSVYYGLNEVGTRIWNLLQQPRTVGQLLDVLLDEYEVDSARCERDLLALLEKMRAEGLIQVRSAAAVQDFAASLSVALSELSGGTRLPAAENHRRGLDSARRDFLMGEGLNAIMRAWRGFWRMDRVSRGVALEAAAALAATRAGLRVAGLRRWKIVLTWFAARVPSPATSPDVALIETARQIARIQEAASRHLIFHPSCLEQSLVLWWLLGRRGIPADLRFGARKEAGRFEAHAWVEVRGAILNDPDAEHLHFAPFDGSIVSMETQTH